MKLNSKRKLELIAMLLELASCPEEYDIHKVADSIEELFEAEIIQHIAHLIIK